MKSRTANYLLLAAQGFLSVWLGASAPVYFRDAFRAKAAGDTFKYHCNIVGAWAYVCLLGVVCGGILYWQWSWRRERRKLIIFIQKQHAVDMSRLNDLIRMANEMGHSPEMITHLVEQRQEFAESYRQRMEELR